MATHRPLPRMPYRVSPPELISEKLSWGLGWGIQQTDAGECFWQFGEGEWAPFQNLALAFRERGIGVVIFTNSANGEEVFEYYSQAATRHERPVLINKGL